MPVRICHVLGARPNYMKAAPVLRAISKYFGVEQTVVHTGQHYDFNMSDAFFQQLGMPEPDFNLQVGSGTHAQQTAAIMSHFEPVVLKLQPRVVVVYGDVNSTIAAALVCSKLGIAVAHVEAGLRSFDRTMPEEINRLLTDQICDVLYTTERSAADNLRREGVPMERVHFVGNVMIDSLRASLPHAVAPGAVLASNGLDAALAGQEGRFGLVTLHRPSNVDEQESLVEAL